MNLLDERRRQLKEQEHRKTLKSIPAVFDDLKRNLIWEPPPASTPRGGSSALSCSVSALSSKVTGSLLPLNSPRSAQDRHVPPEVLTSGPPTAHELVLRLYGKGKRQRIQQALPKLPPRRQSSVARQPPDGDILDSGMDGVGNFSGALLKDSANRTLTSTLEAWRLVARNKNYHRKRSALRTSLVWDNASRARVLMEARAALEGTRSLSWLCAPARKQGGAAGESRAALPMLAPPDLRVETQREFVRVAESLRTRLHSLISSHEQNLTECDGEVVQRWMFKEQIKDVKLVERRDAQAAKQLEEAKRHLVQAPAFLRLIELVLASHLTWSVEDAGEFMLQIFGDTTFLQLPVMAYPRLLPAREGHPATAVLQPSPGHADVQEHLNSLMEALVDTAEPVLRIQKEPGRRDPSLDADEEGREGADAADRPSLIRLFLASSRRFRSSVQGLDKQLRRCFRAADKRLQAMQERLGPPLVTSAALLGALYTDRATLGGHIAHWGRSGCGPAPRADSVGNRLLADFLFFWFSGPHAERQEMMGLLRPLFHCVAMVCASAQDLSLGTLPLPARVVCKMFPNSGVVPTKQEVQAHVEEDVVEGNGSTRCTQLHSSLRDVARHSASFADLFIKQVVTEGKFRETVQGFPEDLSLTPTMCAWLAELVARCGQYQDEVRELKMVVHCGPLKLDMEYLGFLAAQVPTATLGAGVYLMNLFALHSGRSLFREIRACTAELDERVASLSDIVREMEILRGIYARALGFQESRKQLEQALRALMSAVRSPYLATAASRLLGQQVKLDVDCPGEADLPDPATEPLRQPGGGLSTGAVAFLAGSLREVISRLADRAQDMVATAAGRVDPFKDKSVREVQELSESMDALFSDLAAALNPSDRLAEDARMVEDRRWSSFLRCKDDGGYSSLDPSAAALGLPPRPPTPRQPLATMVGGETPLTVGDHRTHQEVAQALAAFERRLAELEGRRDLVLQYQGLAGCGGPAPSREALSRLGSPAAERLSQLRALWSAVREWDKSVDRWLKMRPEGVPVNDVQRIVHTTLRAARECPESHRTLVRERVDAFRQLLPSLLLVQALIVRSPLCQSEGGNPIASERRLLRAQPQTRRLVWALSEQLLLGAGSQAGVVDASRSTMNLWKLIRQGFLGCRAHLARAHQLAIADEPETPAAESPAPALEELAGAGEPAALAPAAEEPPEAGGEPAAAVQQPGEDVARPGDDEEAPGEPPAEPAAEPPAAQEEPVASGYPPTPRASLPRAAAPPVAPPPEAPPRRAPPPPACPRPWKDRSPRRDAPAHEPRSWRLPPTADLGDELEGGNVEGPPRWKMRPQDRRRGRQGPLVRLRDVSGLG